MRRRKLGRTGLEVSELALGTWGLSGDAYAPVAEAEQDRVIDRALALGITLFDTADCYARGGMERKLGERLPSDGSAFIVTKLGNDLEHTPPRKRFDRGYLEDAVSRSRERLGRDTLDVVLLHNPAASTLQSGEAASLMDELRDQGALRAWGVSSGAPEVARAAIAAGAQVIELAYNAFFASDLHELQQELQTNEVGVLARSVLAHGLLTGYWTADKHFPSSDHRSERWTPDELRRRVYQLRAVKSVVGPTVHTLRSASLRFVLSNEIVCSAVLGPRNAVQLDQLIREGGKGPPYLSDEALRKLATRLADVGVGP